MEISRFGIGLRPLEASHLELVRKWRNLDRVRLRMEHQEKISSTQQEQWFEALNPEENFYFLAQFEGRPSAVVNVKNIDWKNLSGESGIFVGEEQFLNTTYPLLAVLALNDLAFFLLGLEKLVAKIAKKENHTTAFNRELGFERIEKECHPSFQYFALDPQKYLTKAKKFRTNAGKTYGWNTVFKKGEKGTPDLMRFLDKISGENRKLLQPVIL